MPYKKIIGWALTALGILIIALGIYSSFNIFTGKSSAPEIFKASQEAEKTALDKEDPQKEAERMVNEQISKIIPQDAIYKILNLASWSIFAAILFLGGGKIASIGIGMLKS